MCKIRLPLQMLVLLGCLSPLAQAEVNCGAGRQPETHSTVNGSRHHPIGRPLPLGPTFNQPTGCSDGVWFFDLNHNGRAEAGEPQLYGASRVIECSSCHAESPDAKAQDAVTLFLRQDASVLCLVCHNL